MVDISFSLFFFGQMLKVKSLGGSGKWLKLTPSLIGYYIWFFIGSLLDSSLLNSRDLGSSLWWHFSQSMNNYLYVKDHYQLPAILRDESWDDHIHTLSCMDVLVHEKHVPCIITSRNVAHCQHKICSQLSHHKSYSANSSLPP